MIKIKSKRKKQTILQQKGITLVALVITIIILLILAGITISSLTESGLFARAIQASEETKISEYTEKIELIKAEVRLNKSNPAEIPTLNELKDAFDNENWVDSTDIIMDNDIEKLKLITKEGYIFYITVNKTEYKGKGIVVDTSALERDDVLKLEITTTNENGRMVKITDITGVDYYKIQYQIGSEDGDWTEIQSGNEVEVPFGEIIYARLIYGTNYGVTYRMSVAHTDPTLTVSENDYSNVTRKTDIPLSDLFQVTWGSEGVGTIEYSISGNLTFNNTSFSSKEINNISNLELGTYTITCKAITPSNQIGTITKENVKITTLKNTTVTNSNDESIEAYAIYSEYDLAYFRDLVNNGQNTINVKLMNDIDLANVCSISVGSWKPIGYNSGSSFTEYIEYKGIFDGNKKNILNIYSNGILENNETIYGGGLFGVSSGYINNVIIAGTFKATQGTAGIVVWNKGKVVNCNNNVEVTTLEENGSGGTAGICAWNYGTISQCKNEGIINGKSYVGGIAGSNFENGLVSKCVNSKEIIGNNNVGGIVGYNLYQLEDSYNTAEVKGSSKVAGIVGLASGSSTDGKLMNVYNIAMINGVSYVGGIAGILEGKCSTSNWYNAGSINGKSYVGNADGYQNDYVGTWSGKGIYDLNVDTIKGWSLSDIQSTYLNNNFIKDSYNKNNGLPILIWQVEEK